MNRATTALRAGCLLSVFGLAPAVLRSQDDTSLNQLRSQANAVFAREAAREKAGDCNRADTTLAMNTCLSKENETSSANWQALHAAIRGLLDSHAQEAFDEAEAAWENYRRLQCAAAFELYQGGTIAPGTRLSCNLLLLRSHMRELKAVYSDKLNN